MIRLTLTIRRIVPSLNKLMRMHWAKYKREREAWSWLILEAFRGVTFSGGYPLRCCRIIYTRFSTKQLDKGDNLNGSFKPIGDSLVRCNIIADDSPDVVVSFEARQEKVKSRKEHKTVIEIEEAE